MSASARSLCFCIRCVRREVAEQWWDRAIALHEESYELYMKARYVTRLSKCEVLQFAAIEVLGPKKPLTGWAMEDLAGAYQRPRTVLKTKLSYLSGDTSTRQARQAGGGQRPTCGSSPCRVRQGAMRGGTWRLVLSVGRGRSG